MAGQPFIRSHVLDTVAQTIERSRDAVDYEFQNIDGILFEAGLPRLNRATAKNVQRLLRYVTLDPLAQHSEVFESSKRIVVTTSTEEVFVEALIIDASILDLDNDVSSLKATKIDFSRRDAANRNLGRSGEEFVLELEQKRLKELGRPDLAEKVRWVSKDDGDGLGYDIASFEVDETPIYIEVKTTNQGEAAPFYVSETERQVAELRGEAYILYRVFDLSDSPKVYRIRGPFSERLMMRPVNYIALPIS
jgi:hypothetical protein